MELFHAAPTIFTAPDPHYFREDRDFGPCLYTSDDLYDARQYADKRLNGGYVLKLDVDIDHLDYTHTYNGLNIHVFDYDNDDDIILWMRTVIGNRIINRTGYDQFLDDIDDIQIFVGLRADGDLERIIEAFAQQPDILFDEDRLLVAFDEELLKQYEMNWQVALTYEACQALIDPDINPMIEV